MRHKEKIRKKNKLIRFAFYLLLFSIPFSFSLIWFLTRFSFYPLNSTGEIGDTISGITMPIISIVGSILVFLSFNAQVEANQILTEDIERNSLLREYDQLNDLIQQMIGEFDSLKFDNNTPGFSSIMKFLENHQNELFSSYSKESIFLKNFSYVMETIDLSSRRIYYFTYDNSRYKNFIRKKFINFYRTKIFPVLEILKQKENFRIFLDDDEKSLKKNTSIYAYIVFKIKNVEETLEPKSKFWE